MDDFSEGEVMLWTGLYRQWTGWAAGLRFSSCGWQGLQYGTWELPGRYLGGLRTLETGAVTGAVSRQVKELRVGRIERLVHC